MEQYNHMLTAGCLIEDTGEGRVILGPDLQPWLAFKLARPDVEKLHRGVRYIAEQLFAAGARKVLLPFGGLPELDSPDQLDRIDERKHIKKDVELLTVHIMSSCRMSNSAATGVCDNAGRVHDVDGLVIADASVIPSSVGVNPMETIIALALRNCDRWIATMKQEGRAQIR